MDWSVRVPTMEMSHPCLNRVLHFALENLDATIDLNDLSKAANVNPFYLCRLFKRELGISPMSWLWMQRTFVAASHLVTDSKKSLTDIAFACGFSSSSHFSRFFKKIYQMNPSRFRQEVIRKKEIGPIPYGFSNGKMKFVSLSHYA